MVEETGAVFIHPSNDPRVAAGQGTAGVELVEQTADIGVCARFWKPPQAPLTELCMHPQAASTLSLCLWAGAG